MTQKMDPSTEAINFSLKTTGGKPVYVIPLRTDYKNGPVKVFTSLGKNPKLTNEARQQIVLDSHFVQTSILQNKIDTLEARADKSDNDGPVTPSKPIPLTFSTKTKSGQNLQTNQILANHYGVTARSIKILLKESRENGQIESSERPGRPTQFTPTKRKALVEVHNRKKGRVSLKGLSNGLEGKTTWKTKHRDKILTTPSPATLSRELNDDTFQVRMIRKRPLIEGNDRAIQERREFPNKALKWDDTSVVMHDEAYCQPCTHLGKFLIDLKARPDVADNLEESDVPVEFDSGGKHEPKIFLFGAVTCPEVVLIDGKRYIHPKKNGKVMLARVRGVKKRKSARGSKKRGEPMYENVTITGSRYMKLFQMQGGYMNAIQQYMDIDSRPPDYQTARVLCIDLDEEEREERANENDQAPNRARWDELQFIGPIKIIIQEDGAPGHGFDNRNNRGSQTHEDLVFNCRTQGMELVKQSRHSPEINNMDLGVWRILKSAVEQNSERIPEWNGKNADAIEAAIWNIAKGAWNEMDPRKLYIIAQQRREMLNEMLRLEGKSITIEPHSGLRKKHKDLQHDPDFVLEYLRTRQV